METNVDINLIKSITPPALEELKKMNLEGVKEWLDKLHPFYYQRSEILSELGFEQWQKVINWPFIYKLYEELEKST